MKTERNAADFGLEPEFFGYPDRLVALAEYMQYLQLESINWYMETGERIRSRGLYAMVSDELQIDADVLHDWVACGEAIRWDRELQAMSPDEREAHLAEMQRDPTPEELAEFERFDKSLAHDGPTFDEIVQESRQANYEIDLLNRLFRKS
jgi:hypothetical protein